MLLLGCVAKLSSRFIYADPLYVRVGGGLYEVTPTNILPVHPKPKHGRAETPPAMLNQSIATTKVAILEEFSHRRKNMCFGKKGEEQRAAWL